MADTAIICAKCSKPVKTPKRCGRCKAVVYCSRECQSADWKKHKKSCQEPWTEVKATFLVEDINMIEGFRARPLDIFQALTDTELIKSYTRVKPKMDVKIGGRFTLFGGTITGKFVELNDGKAPGAKKALLVMKWRFKDWPDNYYSDVRIELTAEDDVTTKLKMTQKGVPVEDKFGNRDVPAKTEQGWNEHFWSKIQKVLGFSKQHV